MKKIITIIALILISSSISFSQTNEKYEQSLKKFFEVSGQKATSQTSIHNLLAMYKELFPKITDEIWSKFEQEFSVYAIDELYKHLTPVYIKYLTQEDIDELISFYESPIGKKYATKLPFITNDSMKVGAEWGKKIGEEFIEKIKKEGY